MGTSRVLLTGRVFSAGSRRRKYPYENYTGAFETVSYQTPESAMGGKRTLALRAFGQQMP
jgi:hypothetical protein